MKSLIVALSVAFLAVVCPVRAAAQDSMDSPRVTFSVEKPLLVGDVTLTPGSYKFQCRHVDGKTFLVVTDENNKEITRVACEQETLSQKNENSELRSTVRRDGTRALKSVRIKGETLAHRLAE